ncbi:MAG: hypothetical protein HQ568_01670 [Calditrichaeota bacterium]|nr:hypothetical protein [Calditrichota bacterium]
MVLSNYKYRGARAMILLHEMEMWRFLEVWHEAKDAGIKLPETKDSDYASYGALLRHVMRASRGYMTWMCKMLELPDPKIDPTPDADVIEAEADDYLKHLIDRYRRPLAKITEEQCYSPEYKSRWGTMYSIEAMLEHAVMHPIRHSFQLEELMKGE